MIGLGSDKNTINYRQESESHLFDIREKHGKGDDKLGPRELKLASNFLSSGRNRSKLATYKKIAWNILQSTKRRNLYVGLAVVTVMPAPAAPRKAIGNSGMLGSTWARRNNIFVPQGPESLILGHP